MSTRAIVAVCDFEFNEYFLFYRHSDGYPEGVKEALDKFTRWVKEGRIRNNLTQSAGWLIIIGAEEYKHHQIPEISAMTFEDRFSEEGQKKEKEILQKYEGVVPSDPVYDGFSNWKVGSYEPTTHIHGDIEHLYIIDVSKGKWWEAESPKELPGE